MPSPDFLPLITFNHQHRVRSLVVFYGSNSWCLEQARSLTFHYDNGLYVDIQDAATFPKWQCIEEKKFRTQLGREWDAIVYNAKDGITPDALGALSGCIKAGGVLILCLDPVRIEASYFAQWMEYHIRRDPHVWCYAQDGNTRLGLYPELTQGYISEVDSIYATQEQKQAVAAIKKVSTGHRNRPLVLTADRGRGKTVALGLATKELLHEASRNLHILVTAPKPSAVENLFNQLNSDEKKQVSFIAPDHLCDALPECDLLLVDEAAAIPVPLLEMWVRHYKRIVFSSTVHGYEGAGRGFTIKFNQCLQQITPEYNRLHIREPVRWALECPLERFVFDALLLRNEITPVEHHIELNRIEFLACDFSQPIETNIRFIEQAFSILVSAHYQTSPNDLKNILDLEETKLYLALSYKNKQPHVVGAILAVEEGGIDASLCEDILQGDRRIKGHLLAQSLMTHSGEAQAGTLRSWRVMRIAVHPGLQNQGIGSFLLHSLKERASLSGVDYISTSYGVSASLLRFWQKQMFQAVVLGMKKDAASGTYSLQSMLPISEKAQDLALQLREYLRLNLPYLLSIKQIQIDVSLVAQLAHELCFSKPNSLVFKQLEDYTQGRIGADLIGASLNQWLWYQLGIFPINQLGKMAKSSVQLRADIAFLIQRVILAQEWPPLISDYGKSLSISGQRQAKIKLLEIIRDLK